MPSIYDDLPVFDIPENWILEFRGFFMGDGNASLLAYPRKKIKVYSYRPQFAVRLRSDERPFFDQIVGYLGGFLTEIKPGHRDKYRTNPTTMWARSGWGPCRAILEQVLLGSCLAAKKTRDIDILYEAILYRYTLGGRLGPEGRAKLAEYKGRIEAVRKYSDVKVLR